MSRAVVQLLAATGVKDLRGREKNTTRTEPVERFAKGELRARMSRRQAEVKFTLEPLPDIAATRKSVPRMLSKR